ncbi:hypothetical protein ACWD7F_38820 [Streptomyces sp. NPDC005122]
MPASSADTPADGMLEAAAAAVTAAEKALQAARRDLRKAVVASRQAGETVQHISRRTGLDPVVVRNILAVPPPPAAS